MLFNAFESFNENRKPVISFNRTSIHVSCLLYIIKYLYRIYKSRSYFNCYL